MATPTVNSYSSRVNLNLGQVPQVKDPVLYTALLDIHNAIEILAGSTDLELEELLAFLTKYRNQSLVNVAAYDVATTDGILLVDASTQDIAITLHEVAGYKGWRYIIKRIDEVPTNTVVLLGNGAELVDGRPAGIKVSCKSSYTVSATETGWVII